MRADINKQTGLPFITPTDEGIVAAARAALLALAKPPHSLGALEDVAVRLCTMGGRVPPMVPARPFALVFAGDHGVATEGVTRWPQAVTASMVQQIAAGRAASSVIARAVGAQVWVTDVGVVASVADHPRVLHREVMPGTNNMLERPAMDNTQVRQAVKVGVDTASAAITSGANLICVGDMGISNTTAAAALVATFTGKPPLDIVGPGASGPGVLERKREVVARALELHKPDPAEPLRALGAVGGLEHAACAGAILACASARVPVILDGVNVCAAALVARALDPGCTGYMIAGHRSIEPGATAALESLALDPILSMRLGLGEGTGALLAIPVVQAAAALLGGMARLDEVGG